MTPEFGERLLIDHFRLDPGWARALAPVAPNIAGMVEVLHSAGTYLPHGSQVLRAFWQPFEQVKILIMGQDPYPTPGDAMGLSFSVNPDRELPPSLRNIFAEYTTDLGLAHPRTGDLTPWSHQGVCLLNRTLTVAPGQPASHRGLGWEPITECAVRALAARGTPLVSILWGRQAQETRRFTPGVPAVTSPHPSPLSAHRGFFGSRPFSTANRMLIEQGADPVDWTLP